MEDAFTFAISVANDCYSKEELALHLLAVLLVQRDACRPHCTQHSIEVEVVPLLCCDTYYNNDQAVEQCYLEYDWQAVQHYSLQSHWQAVQH